MEAIRSLQAASIVIPAIGQAPSSKWNITQTQDGQFKFHNIESNEIVRTVKRFMHKWGKRQVDILAEVTSVDLEGGAFIACCCSEDFAQENTITRISLLYSIHSSYLFTNRSPPLLSGRVYVQI
jgi:hypothetical protein